MTRVFPGRDDLNRAWAAEWGMEGLQTECWMVAAGIGASLTLLSPRVWDKEACEHDPSDPVHMQELIAHELVHVFHGQNSPRPDFQGMDAVGWFPEGLAVYVSGQLERSHAGRDREAIEAGAAPKELESAWSGKYRYGVSGSLVRFIDVNWGRETLAGLLGATGEEEILGALGVTETELLDRWRRFVTEAEK